MGFWDSVGNAFSDAFATAGSRAIFGIGLSTKSDHELLNMFEKLETFFQYHDEADEEHQERKLLKESIENVLKMRGYRAKTIYFRDDEE